ncbi:hypothetical protein B0H34DRAFT_670346 [Crassisporium funariophilum]|nr:hypothetical protein B0H34DRAFT_670346 [Crassisporium funariophilum]
MTRVNLVHLLYVLFSLLISVDAGWNKWEATNFCKCICFQSNYAILSLNIPDNPSQPCLSCTKQWCLNQNLPICAGASLGDTNPDTATGKEGDVEARCFLFGLLLGAGIKNRIMKAGLAPELPWSRRDQTRWWEPWIPGRQQEETALGLERFENAVGSMHEGGHTVLGSGPNGDAKPTAPPDRRAAAAEAAERRLQAAQKRGTTDANPKQGKLSAQLAKQSSIKPATQDRQDERLVLMVKLLSVGLKSNINF